MNLSFQRLDKVRALIMVSSFVLALGSTAGAAVQLRTLSATEASVGQIGSLDAPMPKIVIETTSLQKTDYQRLADRLHILYPELIATAGEKSIFITGNSPHSYQAWRLAVSETMPNGGSAQWSLKQFCAGSCDGAYFKAEVAVSKIAVGVKAQN